MNLNSAIKYSGVCYYCTLEDIESSPFTYFEEAGIENATIISQETDKIYKIKFDIKDSANYAGGYVVGFLYPAEKKFNGKFRYSLDSKITEPEFWQGNYVYENNNLEIRGPVNTGRKDEYGFFIQIEISDWRESAKKGVKKSTIVPSLKTTILSQINFDRINKLAEKIKQGHKHNYDSYSHAISLKLKPNTVNDIYIAMCIAYSWMPTMLDIYEPPKRSLDDYVPIVKSFAKYKTLEIFQKNEKKIFNDFFAVAKLVNNSVVGASKMLHLFYPTYVPIIDSRVLKGWNNFFVNDVKQFPEIKLPSYFPDDLEKQVEMYIRYWKLLLRWGAEINIKNIRKFEEPFYWIGKSS